MTEPLSIIPLYEHQAQAALKMQKGSYAPWHEQGLGKTRSALVAFRYLQQTNQADVMIVVCPKIAKNVWKKEAELCGMDTPTVIHGTKANAPITSLDGIIVLNYDILAKWLNALIAICQSRTVVVCFDEAHNLRNYRINRYKAAAKLTPFAAKVWELTGTQMVNGAMDIYYQGRLAGPEFPFYYWSKKRFGDRYCKIKYNPFSRSWEYFGIDREDELMERLDGFAERKLKKDCLDLPDKLRLPMWVAKQDDWGITFNGSAASSLAEARHQLSPVKAKLTIAYLEEALDARPVVVVGYHHDFMGRVAQHFDAPIISGNTPERQRNEYIEAYEAGQIPILVGQIQAMGTAITLVKGCNLVFGELHWSAVDHRQCEDRLHRPGQERDVSYHYLMVEKSVDELVWKHVLRKGNAIDRLDAAAYSLNELVPLFAGEGTSI